MGTGSAIEWCTHTFNPWIGCSKVSAGCTHCYAEQLMDVRFGKASWGLDGTRERTNPAYWKLPLKWNKQAEESDTRPRVFCASLADVFEDRPALAPWRSDLFALIDATPHLDWLLLTKRPQNIIRLWPVEGVPDFLGKDRVVTMGLRTRSNVWLGTSVENQATANDRIPQLLYASPLAAQAFLSCEPLLGPVDLAAIPTPNYLHRSALDPLTGYGALHMTAARGLVAPSIDWVIGGGESGGRARPMHPDWIRSLRDQCASAGVPFFFKQWGAWAPAPRKHQYARSESPVVLGQRLAMKRMRKGLAGRLLDGRTHDAVPEPRTISA